MVLQLSYNNRDFLRFPSRNTSTYQIVQNGIKSQSILKVKFCKKEAFALSKYDYKLIQKYDSRLIKIF